MLITCSTCQSTIRVPDDAVGMQGKCPKCGTILTITAAEAAPSPSTGYASQVPPPLPPAAPSASKAGARYDDFDEEPGRGYDRDDNEDWSIRRRRIRKAPSAGLSIAAMILGVTGLFLLIVSVVASVFITAAAGPAGCCVSFLGGYVALAITGILGLLGVILGFTGMRQGGRGYAWAGVGTGSATILAVLVCLLLTFLGVIAAVGIGAAGAAAAAQQQQQLQQQQQRRFVPPAQPAPPPRFNPPPPRFNKAR
jgi:predicted Zn finger-like uncharacterized protein